MEWQGINLTDYNTKKWVNKSKLNIFKVVIFIFILLILIYSLYAYQKNIYSDYIIIKNRNSIYKNKITKIENNIINFSKPSIIKKEYIPKEKISEIINYLKEIKTSGSLLTVKIYKYNNKDILNIEGNINNKEKFTEIEEQLKIKKYQYTIDKFQTINTHSILFSISIY